MLVCWGSGGKWIENGVVEFGERIDLEKIHCDVRSKMVFSRLLMEADQCQSNAWGKLEKWKWCDQEKDGHFFFFFAKWQQVDMLSCLLRLLFAVPSGLINGLNPGIINNVRNKIWRLNLCFGWRLVLDLEEEIEFGAFWSF